MRETLNIVVAATIASTPKQAGWTWAVLQYVLGFRQLGHRVTFIDPIRPSALMPGGASLANTANAAAFRTIAQQFGLAENATLLLADTKQTVGGTYEAVANSVRDADVLLNISGALRDAGLLAEARYPVYVDVDPAFTQLWQKIQGIEMGLAGHRRFVTVGLRVGAGAPVPLLDKAWVKTLPPIVLTHWPVSHTLRWDALTTIANWRGYGSIEYDGRFYGQKAHSLRAFITLPQRTTERFVLALGIDAGERRDLEALSANGWELIDPMEVVATTDDYHAFVQGSKAEFAIAKSGYVVAECGWFSDRSVCYLASGRPVIAQDTGFGECLPTGDGLFRFTTEHDVLAAIDAVNSDYPRHARAARQLAEDHFDSRRVLSRLLREIAA